MKFTNLSTVLDPFVAFTFGGDYTESIKKTKDGELVKRIAGDRKIFIISDTILSIDRLATREFLLSFEGELDLSYQDLEDSDLVIEVI